MAVLTATQMAELRRGLAKDETVTWTKAQANDAFQRTENFIETNRATINAALDLAFAPLVLTSAQKAKLLASYFEQKASRGG